jgi:hypothetical protein
VKHRLAGLSLCLLLGFCATDDRDSLAAYRVDPAAFSIPVTTFSVVPF